MGDDDEGLLTFDVHDDGSVCTFVVCGEMDLGNCRHLETALIALADEGRHIAVDLSAVGFMDSTGLQCLVTAQNAAIAKHSTLLVTAWSEPVEHLLRMTGTWSILTGDYATD